MGSYLFPVAAEMEFNLLQLFSGGFQRGLAPERGASVGW